MRNYARRFRAFGERRLQEHLSETHQQLQDRINGEPENYILNVNETEYINHLVETFSIQPPFVDFDGLTVSHCEQLVAAENFPRTFNVLEGKSYPRPVVVFHLPASGNTQLLSYQPDQWYDYYPEVVFADGEICVEQVVFSQTPEQIREGFNHELRSLRGNYDFLIRQVEAHNQRLRQLVGQSVQGRKRQLLERNQLLAGIGVPIKKRDSIPRTYAVPTAQTRKRISSRPTVTEKGFTPDPTLDDQTYQDILQTIHGVGKVFERLPETYRDKDEEALRDHFLLYLEPRNEGSATGETFNGSGKTDILIRHQNSNIFVAECKFWSGPKAFLDTVSQLLRYLTWRDSKSAVVVFVRNKEIVPVVRAVKEATPTHANYLGFVDEQEESWLNFRFHINGDPNREVKLAVLLFHIPSE